MNSLPEFSRDKYISSSEHALMGMRKTRLKSHNPFHRKKTLKFAGSIKTN